MQTTVFSRKVVNVKIKTTPKRIMVMKKLFEKHSRPINLEVK